MPSITQEEDAYPEWVLAFIMIIFFYCSFNNLDILCSTVTRGRSSPHIDLHKVDTYKHIFYFFSIIYL